MTQPLKNMTTLELMDEAVMLSNDLEGVLQELVNRGAGKNAMVCIQRALNVLAQKRGKHIRGTVIAEIIAAEQAMLKEVA